MPRVVLNVPKAEKDRAKELGAKWDAVQEKWYVPNGIEPWPFEPWFTDIFKRDHPEVTSKGYTIRANYFYIVKAMSPCGYCSRPTDMIGFVVPDDHWQLEEDDTGSLYWYARYAGQEEIVWGVSKLNGPALAAAAAISSHYRRSIRIWKQTGREYPGPYVSHCAHCGRPVPEMGSDFHHPLFPATYKKAEEMYRYYFAQEFKAQADDTIHFWDEWMFDIMQIANVRS